MILAHLPRYANRLGIVDTRRARPDARRVLGRLRVRTPSLQTPITSLSGGNQQKVLFGRWLLAEPEILILDEPTRGIDVGAKFEIYTIINELAAQGKGIIMISSELPELIGESDRIVVMCRGRLTGMVEARRPTRPPIMRLATDIPDDEPRSSPVSEALRPPARSSTATSAAAGARGGRPAHRSAIGSPPTSSSSCWSCSSSASRSTTRTSSPRTASATSCTNSSTRILVALGAGIVLISRGVDLSGGRMVGLAAVVSASMLQTETYSRLFFPDLPACR